jgi:hypothetical protein
MYVEHRRREYEEQSANGRVRRHEMWRHHYLADPYLIGCPDDRVGERFRHIFVNQTELTPEGKVGMLDVHADDSFMQTFTHLLEEYGVRGGTPVDVIAAARAPILRYFENGDPIALSIFSGYTPPAAPIFVKYGRREFLEPMLRDGQVRICPASFYNSGHFLEAIRDDEVTRNFFVPTYKERLKGERHLDFQGHRIEFGDDDIVLPVVVPDYYLLSVCDHIYYRMPTDFDANAALIIRDPALFTQRVASAFLSQMGGWEPLFGPVTYYDPYRHYTKFKIPELAKHFGYAYQREHRIVFRAKRRPLSQLEPVFLNIGPMFDYAELLSTE